MAKNDFLLFGTGAGSNVLSQSAYAALAARQTGFLSGVAKSAELNKVWRQSAFISSVIAQFISDQTGLDVLDDGDAVTLEYKFRAAILAYMQTRAASEVAAGTLKLATTAQAQALTDDTAALTPKKLADAFKGSNQSTGVAGYQKFPGGVIIQWGNTTVTASTGDVSTPFPIVFPSSLRTLILSPGTTSSMATATFGSVNTASFGSSIWGPAGSRIGGLTGFFIAVGA